MAAHQSWKVLSLEAPNVPKLLMKYIFDRTGYRVYLTDLGRIWEENLNKVDCIQRAIDSGSSIDPSQDEEQFDILLREIQSALNLEKGTSLQLKASDEDEEGLTIQLTSALPQPLPPLEWTVNLRLLPPSGIRSQLVSPLLNQASRLQYQIEQLVSQLQDKDRVISKICDRLETSGNDLTTVFPGVSNIKTSRKKGQREQLAKHVKGLADFDERLWREKSNHELGDQMLNNEELDAVFHGIFVSESETVDEQSEWWKHLDREAALPATQGRRTAPKPSNGVVRDEYESFQDDEFQRQGTPPHLKQHSRFGGGPEIELPDETPSHGKKGPAPSSALDIPGDDESTEDEDDLDAIPKQPNTTQPPKRTGSVGGRQHHDSTSAQSSPKKLGTIGGRSPLPPAPSVSRKSTPEQQAQATKPSGKLGTIGGKASSSRTAATESASPEQSLPLPAHDHKVGVVGGKKEKDSSVDAMSTEERPEAEVTSIESPPRSRASAKQTSPPPRETSQERADRKRDLLKRQLEEKAQAPVKKKRKF